VGLLVSAKDFHQEDFLHGLKGEDTTLTVKQSVLTDWLPPWCWHPKSYGASNEYGAPEQSGVLKLLNVALVVEPQEMEYEVVPLLVQPKELKLSAVAVPSQFEE